LIQAEENRREGSTCRANGGHGERRSCQRRGRSTAQRSGAEISLAKGVHGPQWLAEAWHMGLGWPATATAAEQGSGGLALGSWP